MYVGYIIVKKIARRCLHVVALSASVVVVVVFPARAIDVVVGIFDAIKRQPRRHSVKKIARRCLHRATGTPRSTRPTNACAVVSDHCRCVPRIKRQPRRRKNEYQKRTSSNNHQYHKWTTTQIHPNFTSEVLPQ